MSDVHSSHLLLNSIQFTLIHGPNSLGCCAILLLRASDSTFTTRLIHNLVSFPLQPSLFILPELFLCSSEVAYWTPMDLGGLSYLIFLPFHTVHGILKARILKWFVCHSLLHSQMVRLKICILELWNLPQRYWMHLYLFCIFCPNHFFLVISCDLPNYMTLSSALMFMKLLKAFFIITFSDFFCFFFLQHFYLILLVFISLLVFPTWPYMLTVFPIRSFNIKS